MVAGGLGTGFVISGCERLPALDAREPLSPIGFGFMHPPLRQRLGERLAQRIAQERAGIMADKLSRGVESDQAHSAI